MKIVCMLGEGAWGTAIATLLAHNGFTVKLWCHDAGVAKTIEQKRVNQRYLPGITLHKNIVPVTTVQDALHEAELIFEAIPVQYLRSIVEQCKPFCKQTTPWIVLSKGIEQNTLLFPTALIDDILGYCPQKAILAGPSFAKNVAEKTITAVTLAVEDCDFGVSLQKQLANEYFRPYISRDLIGVQLGAALKNVIALATGMLDGAGYTDNAQAFILTRGFHEMVEIATALGARKETLYGLSGLGDVVLTSMGGLSKNREVGKRLGAGQTLPQILKETGFIPEGINTVEALHQWQKKLSLELPVFEGIYAVVHGRASIGTVLQELMARPLEQECATDS
ncbi:MAG: NAD(P)H-dependent glycerol-3-phosphate dehydrogenase [Candidatus Babeliales bacterium]